jgi:vancomycin permeability regulator SanA
MKKYLNWSTVMLIGAVIAAILIADWYIKPMLGPKLARVKG